MNERIRMGEIAIKRVKTNWHQFVMLTYVSADVTVKIKQHFINEVFHYKTLKHNQQ